MATTTTTTTFTLSGGAVITTTTTTTTTESGRTVTTTTTATTTTTTTTTTTENQGGETSTSPCSSGLPGFDWQFYGLQEGGGFGAIPYASCCDQDWATNRVNLDFALHGQKFDMNGRTRTIGTGDSCPVKWPIYGSHRPFQTEFIAMQYTGYFNPRTAGTYTFELTVLKRGTSGSAALYLWLGEQDVLNYTNNNTKAISYTGAATISYKYEISRRGQSIPIRIAFLTGQGCASFWVRARDPNSNLIFDNTKAVADNSFTGGCLFPSLKKPNITRPEPTPQKGPCNSGFRWAFYGMQEGSGPGRLPFHSVDAVPAGWFSWASSKFDIRVSLFNQTPIITGETRFTTLDRGCTAASSPIWGKNPNWGAPYNIVQQVGYLQPSAVGKYTFTLKADEAVYLWIGEQARWDFRNADAHFTAGLASYYYEVTEINTFIPLRILGVNAQGCFNYDVQIIGPNNQLIVGKNQDLKTDEIVTCSPDESDNAPILSFN